MRNTFHKGLLSNRKRPEATFPNHEPHKDVNLKGWEIEQELPPRKILQQIVHVVPNIVADAEGRVAARETADSME
jgi:hypothetical protein